MNTIRTLTALTLSFGLIGAACAADTTMAPMSTATPVVSTAVTSAPTKTPAPIKTNKVSKKAHKAHKAAVKPSEAPVATPAPAAK